MNKKNRQLNHILAFFIPAITILIAFIAGGFAPFGDMNIFSFEGLDKYIPYFNEFYDKFKHGESLFYSTRTGMGYSFASIWSFYLSDPTNLIILLFPKQSMFAVLDILYLLKISLCGLTFSIMLTEIEKKKINTAINLKPALFGISYALSGYMLGQGLNVTWLSSVALLPLIILGIHKIMEEQKPALFMITYGASFFCNFYVTIMISIFVFFYFISRDFVNIRHFLKSFGLYILMSILAIGCGMVIIIPSIKGDFFQNIINMYFPYHGTLASIFDSVKMLLPGNHPSVISENAFGMNIYCGTFILLLVVCYTFNSHIKRSTRVKNLALAFFMFFSTFFATTNYFLNGFYNSTSPTCNFGFILIFMSLIIAYDSFGNIKHISALKLTICSFLVLLLILGSMLFATDYDSVTPFITALELTLLYFVIVLFYKKDNITRVAFRITTFFIVVVEMCGIFVNTTIAISDNAYVYNQSETYEMELATDYVLTNHPNSRILHYYSTDSNTSPLTNILDGYDYVLAYGNDTIVDSMLTYVETYHNVAIYKNPYAVSVGVLAKDYIKNWNFSEDYPYISLNDLSDNGFFGYEGGHLFIPIEGNLKFNLQQDENNKKLYYFSIQSPINCDLYMNLYNIVHIGMIEAGETVTYPYEFTTEQARNLRITLTYTSFDTDNFNEFYNSLIKATITENTLTSRKATIEAEESGVFLTNISYEKGWSVLVDGHKVPTYAISDKYLAFDMEKGSHTITMQYKPVWLLRGFLFSVFSILVSLFIMLPGLKSIYTKLYQKVSCSKIANAIADFLSDNRQYCYFVLLSVAIIALSHLIKQCVPFGNYMPMGNDSIVQSLPYISNIMSQVRHFSFGTINWGMGMGIDNLIVFLSGGAFPVNFLMLLFPEDKVLVAFLFIYYVKLIIMGIVFMYYLSHRLSSKQVNKHSILLLAMGVAYSFNGFIISYFNNITFLDMAIMVPITILGLEYLIYKKDNRLYVISLGISMFFNVYYAFLLCMFLVLYFCTLKFDNIKDFFLKGIRFALNSLLTAGITAFSLLPFYLSTKLSPYNNTDTIMGKAFSQNLHYELNRLLPLSIPVTVDYDFWKSNIYCGLLVLLFFGAYVANKNIEKSIRIRKTAVTLLLFLAFGNELLNFVFHGFHVQTGVPNRFAIYWIFLMLSMFCDTILDLHTIPRLALILSSVFGFVLIVFGAFYDTSTVYFKLRTGVVITIAVAYLIFIALHLLKKITSEKLKSIVSVAFLIEISICSIYNFYQIGKVDVSYCYKEVEAINEMATKYPLQENLAYSQSIDSNIVDIGMMTNQNQVELFSSATTSYLSKLAIYLGITGGQNYIQYGTGNLFFDMIMGVRYNMVNNYNEAPLSKYDTIYTYNNYKLAENPYYVQKGIFLPLNAEEIMENVNAIESNFLIQNYLSQAIAGCDLYEIEKITDSDEINDEKNYYYLPSYYQDVLESDEYGDDVNIDLELHLNNLDPDYEYYYSFGGVIKYLEQDLLEDHILYLTYSKKDYLESQEKGKQTFLAKVLPDGVNKLYDTLKASESTNFYYDNNKVSFDVNAKADGFIFPGIPYMPGWSAYVDGEKVDIDLFMEGGIYVPVSQGEHHIELKYHTPGALAGGMVSLLSIVVFILLNVRKKKYTTNSKEFPVHNPE